MTGVVARGGTPDQVLTKITDAIEGQPDVDYDWRDPGAVDSLVPIGRSPLNALDNSYDDVLKAKTIFVPLATDKLAGSLTEPLPDGQQYARTYDGTVAQWIPVAAGGVLVGDAPPTGATANQLWWDSDSGDLFINYQDADSTQFVQINIAAPPTTGIAEAPTDGQQYARQSSAWSVVAAGGLSDAPSDGVMYARQDAAWLPVPSGATGDYLPLDGSLPMTGPVTVAKTDDVSGTFSVLKASNLSGAMRFDLRCVTDETSDFGMVELWVAYPMGGTEKRIFTTDGSTSPGVEFGGSISTPSSVIAGGNVWLRKAQATYQQSFYFSSATPQQDYFRISFDNVDLWSFDRYPDGSNTASYFFQCNRTSGVVDFAQAPTAAGVMLASLSELTARDERIAKLEERLARLEAR
jgi:hypothetical protein